MNRKHCSRNRVTVLYNAAWRPCAADDVTGREHLHSGQHQACHIPLQGPRSASDSDVIVCCAIAACFLKMVFSLVRTGRCSLLADLGFIQVFKGTIPRTTACTARCHMRHCACFGGSSGERPINDYRCRACCADDQAASEGIAVKCEHPMPAA